MRAPYKIVVWGPGRMGQMCIWETTQSPAFELVGVRAYSESKNGIDAGALIGIDPLGVTISTDAEAVSKIDCDCIVYTAHDVGDFQTDDEILTLLAAGKNVVTPLPYQNAHLCRDAAFVEKLEAACRRGGSVFHASGIDPDLISDRVLLSLTGACADIESIRLQENWDCQHVAQEYTAEGGFGMLPEEAEKIVQTQVVARNFLVPVARTVEKVLGVKYDRMVESHDYVPAPEDILEPYLIPKGRVARITHRIQGHVDGIGPQPFFTIEYNWSFGDRMLPEGILPGQYYLATIEGRPSIRMALDLKTSLDSDERHYRIGNMLVEPSYVAILMPCMQAIPHMCEAAPGILPSFGPSLHWMPDLRESVSSR